jgi:hypothetical protein
MGVLVMLRGCCRQSPTLPGVLDPENMIMLMRRIVIVAFLAALPLFAQTTSLLAMTCWGW